MRGYFRSRDEDDGYTTESAKGREERGRGGERRGRMGREGAVSPPPAKAWPTPELFSWRRR